MTQDDYIIGRSPLRFPDNVTKCFLFLEDLNFCCVRSEETFVRYESPMMGINIYHGRRSYEIGLEIQSVQAPTEIYSMSEILSLIDPQKAKIYRNYATHTVEGMVEGVHQLEVLFRGCVDAGILNDKELLFSRLKLQRDNLTKSYWFEMELKQALRESEAAWFQKDFQKVTQILSPFQEYLEPSELKKLEYAKKQIQS